MPKARAGATAILRIPLLPTLCPPYAHPAPTLRPPHTPHTSPQARARAAQLDTLLDKQEVLTDAEISALAAGTRDPPETPLSDDTVNHHNESPYRLVERTNSPLPERIGKKSAGGAGAAKSAAAAASAAARGAAAAVGGSAASTAASTAAGAAPAAAEVPKGHPMWRPPKAAAPARTTPEAIPPPPEAVVDMSGKGDLDALYQYVVLRRDLQETHGWGYGALVAQGSHASVGAIVAGLAEQDANVLKYTHLDSLGEMGKAVLEVRNDKQMDAMAKILGMAKIKHYIWRENGVDTALATYPAPKSKLRPHFLKLQLATWHPQKKLQASYDIELPKDTWAKQCEPAEGGSSGGKTAARGTKKEASSKTSSAKKKAPPSGGTGRRRLSAALDAVRRTRQRLATEGLGDGDGGVTDGRLLTEVRGLSEELGEDLGEQRWHEEWVARISCWWASLPLPTQSQLGDCLGAVALTLASRFDAARRAQSPRPAAASASEPGCEWLHADGGVSLGLPPFPQLPEAFKLELSGGGLPPIPRLLPSLEQLHSLRVQLEGQRDQIVAATAGEPGGWLPEATTVGSTAVGVLGGGVAAVALGGLLVIRSRRRWRVEARVSR